MQQTAGDLGFRRLAPAKDLSQADELVQSLSEVGPA